MYKFDKIDYSFYYSYWLQTDLCKTYCEDAIYKNLEQVVKESFCPSSMVDNSGTLYTVILFSFSSFKGPSFKFGKYAPDENNKRYISSKSNYHYLFHEAASQHSTNENALPNCTENAYSGSLKDDPIWLKNGLHNAFSPILAQEALTAGNTTNDLYVFYINPPLRWMNKNGSSSNHDSEGLIAMKINKNDLSITLKKCIANDQELDRTTGCGYYPLRTSNWAYKLQPE